MPDTTPLTEEEATSLEIPGEWDPVLEMYSPGGAWKWAEPIHAAASDSAKWSHWPDSSPRQGPFELRVAQSAIENLYANGYALVRVSP